MNKSKREQIEALLKDTEKQHDITIILAIESGSRAWGFPSADSDYDIRVIYHRKRDSYLTVFEKRDVIDDIFIDDLDAAGWDITKCLKLLNKGNAALFEWLGSPIVYRKHNDKVECLQQLATDAFNPKAAFYHYVSLAKKKLADEKTRKHPKSFLYALRALLCARWVAESRTAPPVEFARLTQKYLAAGLVATQLAELLSVKEKAEEGDVIEVALELFTLAADLLAELAEREVLAADKVGVEAYDEVMRRVVCG